MAKRRLKIAKNPPSKRRRQKQLTQLQITDVNTDCLENIFERLNIKDLLNVADANKWLRVAAVSAYRHKFGQKAVNLSGLNSSVTGINCTSNEVITYGLKKILQFVRCFGPVIQKLCINYSWSSRKNYTRLDRYVNEFCAETLNELEYREKRTILMEMPVKLFTNVDYLDIFESNLGNQFGEIMKSFPNVRHMKLYPVRIIGNSIEINIPHLVKLSIDLNFAKTNRINHKNVVEMVHMNPQLRSLCLSIPDCLPFFSFTHLLDIVNNNPLIAMLVVECGPKFGTVANRKELLDLVNALPLLEKCFLDSFLLRFEDVIEFMDRAEHLKMFCFHFTEPKDQQFDALKTRLGNEWHSNNQYGMVKLERSIAE